MNIFAVTKRELQILLAQPSAYAALVIYLVISNTYFFILYPFFALGQLSMRPFFEVTSLLLVLLAPVLSMRSIAEERRGGTLELLLALPIRPDQLAIGKYLSLLIIYFAGLSASLLCPLTLAFLGPLDLGATTAGFLGLFLLGAAHLAIGLVASAATKSQVSAFAIAFLSSLAIHLMARLSPLAGPALGHLLDLASFELTFAPFARGVLELRAIFLLVGLAIALILASAELLRPISRVRDRVITWFLLALAFGLGLGIVTINPIRIDLTNNNFNSVSSDTLSLLEQIEGQFEARAYLPSNPPAPYGQIVQSLRDLLEELKSASQGRLRVVYLDPNDPNLDAAERTQLVDEAARFSIPDAELEVLSGDRRLRQRVTFGVALIHGAHHVVVPPIDQLSLLEYEFARALRDLAHPGQRPKIGYTQGRGEPTLPNSPLGELLSSTGDGIALQLKDTCPSPDIDVMVTVGNHKPFDERAVYCLDQFLMDGRAVVLLLDGRQTSEVFKDDLIDNPSGLEGFLAHYGVILDRETLLFDRARAAIITTPADAKGRSVQLNHPLFVPMDTAVGHPITRGLRQLVFPLASPLSTSEEAEVLAFAGPTALKLRRLSSAAPEPLNHPVPQEQPASGLPVAIALTVTTSSYFANREAPTRPGDPPFIAHGRGPARLVVATSGMGLLAAHPNGALFLQNAIDWSTEDTTLLGLRARQAEAPPLADTTALMRFWIKLINVTGPSTVLLLAGLLLARWRRR